MKDKQIGAAGKVGDETDASVGLSDDFNTKNRSTEQAGKAGEREMNLVITLKDYDQLGGRP